MGSATYSPPLSDRLRFPGRKAHLASRHSQGNAMRQICAAVCSVFVGLSAGCATIDSQPAGANKGGVTYFLPKRLLKVSVSPKTADLKKLLETHGEATTALKTATTGVATATAALAKVVAQLAVAKPPATEELLAAKAIAEAELEVSKA